MKNFKGIISPIITPFDDNGGIYEKGIVNLFDFLSKNGVHGVFAVGSYGSFPLMTSEERKKTAEIMVPLAKERNMKIILQIGSPSTAISLDLAKHAESIGADAVSSVVPFYYSSFGYDEDSLIRHYQKIVDAVKIPVQYYNNPRTTGYTITLSLFSKLINVGITGVKDSGANMATFGEMTNIINQKSPNFDLMPGSASILLAGFMLGAEACVAGTSTAFPDVVGELYTAIQKQEIEKAIQLQLRVILARSLQSIKPLRAAVCYDLLQMKGIDVGTCREPWSRLNQKEYDTLLNNLKENELL